MNITGAELFVKALMMEQVDTLFAYPGGQAIDLFDALYAQEDINVILPRHEQGLIHAADGYARSTHKTGVCLVTSGPGATNLVTGIATANYDCVPLVCFTGQVSTSLIGKDAFQEVDMVGISSCICKYAVTVYHREDLSAVIKKAFIIARMGTPGVVVVDLPKNIQQEYGSDAYPKEITFHAYKPPCIPPASQIQKAFDCLANSKSPVILIGGGIKASQSEKEIQLFSEITGVPIVSTIMGKGAVPTSHMLYIGNMGIHGCYAANMAVSRCDVLFSIGTRFNDRITGKKEMFAPHATIIHIDIDPASISKNIAADIPIVSDAKVALNALIAVARPLEFTAWNSQIAAWKQEHPLTLKKPGLTPEKIMEEINQQFTNIIITTDVGQNQLWATQFLELNEQKMLLTSGGFGTMGYGLPAAIGAKIGNPDSHVLVVSGDGGIQMNIQEMATAICNELPLIICILNNGVLGNVRQWQQMFYNKRYSSTCLRYRKSCITNCKNPLADCPEYSPDFIRLAESYGAKGIRVTTESEIAPALLAAKCSDKVPTVIEFIIDPCHNVMPIIPPGNSLEHMLLEEEYLE